MEARWILVLVGGRPRFQMFFLRFVRVCVLLRKLKQWRLSKDGIRFTPSSPFLTVLLASSEDVCRFVSDGFAGFGRRLSSADPLEYDIRLSTFMCLQVGSFRSMLLFIGGGCCSVALVLWGFSMMTSRLSTTTRFARLC